MTELVLTRDGQEILRGGWFEITRYIHDTEPYSLEWALQFEGYRVRLSKDMESQP